VRRIGKVWYRWDGRVGWLKSVRGGDMLESIAEVISPMTTAVD
jgi:hypothetical protein